MTRICRGMLAAVIVAIAAAASGASRRVALTFDDIPGLYTERCDAAEIGRLNVALTSAIRRNRVPALGLVVSGRACGTRGDEMLRSVLSLWLDVGCDLGNHTFSHRDANVMPVDEFERDIVAGEEPLRTLLARRGRTLRYFRFPMLHDGRSAATKEALHSFLRSRHYEEAVVSVDNDDYIFARVYVDALAARDQKLARRIADAYVPYMESMFAFYERFSKDVFGYEPPQIVLLHDHQLNADRLDELIAMLRRRGYAFITAAEALRDPVYSRSDRYTGGKGLSWPHRIAVTEGKPAPDQPLVPRWVMDLFERGGH